ncbi:putative ankyrin repeat protein L88 [Paramyrothecium foliicola]|nr:putative ankyrin repeat protein L88 [Paramyrothecium foliicola]
MAPATASPASPTSPAFFAGVRSPRIGQSFSYHEETNSGLFRQSTHETHRIHSSLVDTSNISRVVYSLKRRGSEELGSSTSAKLFNASHDSIIDWIRTQRMQRLPPEGSSQDKVLAWAQLFVERLHSFDSAIAGFAGDSYLATQLAYGYSAILLELGEENAPALMLSFGFFYNMSVSLVNLLERTELFNVAQDVREQLVLALSDLVTLVASVSTYFHKAINDLTTTSISINIYSTFPNEIRAFTERCEKTAELMWKHQLTREGIDASKVFAIKSMKNWVSPNDYVLSDVIKGVSHLAHDREELTCLWVAPYLTRFLRSDDKVLSLTGPAGSGKTVLSSVIVDYLQHPIGGVSFNTIFIPINKRISAETTPRAIAKSILNQLLEKRIGNVQLLQVLSDAYERSAAATNDQEYDNIIWSAVEKSLAAALPGARELVIIVDGTDEVSGEESALLQRLTKASIGGASVKLVTLGASKSSAANGQSHIQITQDLILDDIARVVRGQLENDKAFLGLSELDQETIVTRLAQTSRGSFLWAKQATKRVRQEKSGESLGKAVNALIDAKTTVNDFIIHTLQSSNVSEDAKLMVLWLATAQRPLSLRELGTLSSIQVDKDTVTNEHQDVLTALKPVSSLVFLQDGLVNVRHGLIKASIIDLATHGKLVTQIKDPHLDLATRLLFYIKKNITQQHEPSVTGLSSQETNQIMSKYPLMDFAVRYWPYHFQHTNVYQKEGESATIKLFSKFLLNSTAVLLLQTTVWEHSATPVLLGYQTLIANICRQNLGPKNLATLQSTISLALLYHSIGLTQESISWLYDATTLSNSLLTARHPVTLQIANTFLELTASSVTSTKTEIMTKREETLLILVECHKMQYGQSSETVVTVLQQLVEHYRWTKEEHKAQKITEMISSITTTETGERDHDLHVHLKGRREVVHSGTGTSLNLDFEEHDEFIEGADSYDFEFFLKRAERYVAEGRTELAERAYIDIWHRVSLEYHSHHTEVWEKRKLKAVLGYSKFLHSQKRETDASSVLSSAYEDYKQSSMTITESSVSLFHEIAKTMKAVGLSYASLSLLKRCSQHYQSTGTSSTTYKEIQQSIQSSSRELMQSISSSKDVTPEATLESMIFEASSSIHTMDQTAFTATFHLVNIYVTQRRWQDATRLIKKVLRTVWPSFFTLSVRDVESPLKSVDACYDLADRLAECHRVRRRIAKEEDVRLRVYYAARNNRNIDDKLRVRATTQLLSFFDRTSQKDKVINIRQEMLDDYTKSYGAENDQVIKMLWELADLTRPRPIFIEYYQKIIRALNRNSDVATEQTFEPISTVANELWNRGTFTDALPYYRILFTTFLKKPNVNGQFQDQTFTKDVFTRYDTCLRSVRSDFEILHKVAVEYRSQCKVVYGATASITTRATLHLAQVCQESKTYEREAISVYEELLQMKSSEIDHNEISAILDVMYEEHADVSVLTKSETVSSSQLTQAVAILSKRVEQTRQTHGWAHEESLSKLTELVSLYSKQQDTQTVLSELNTTTVKVLSTETSSTRLMAAASTIAFNYISSNQVKKATEIKAELYRQIIMKDKSNVSTVGFDLTSRGRESLVFLAQFEYNLRRSSATVNEILAELTTHYIYFAEFRELLKSKSIDLHGATVAAAQLHQSLIKSQRPLAASRVFDDYVRYFAATEGRKLNFGASSQVDILLRILLKHFSTHRSRDFTRSVGISGIDGVTGLLKEGRDDAACDLAHAAHTYISSQDNYRTPEMARLVLILGMSVADRTVTPNPEKANYKNMLETSKVIIQDVLHVLASLNISLENVSLTHLNRLIELLGDQKDFQTLSWLLTALWNSREAQQNWHPSTIFALGKQVIVARYLIGEYTSAVRLAEDIVYNCRRVHGTRHPSTLEMSEFLAQLYTSVAQRYQTQKIGKEMASRYYKKSAAIHENILRVFSDPAYADMDAGTTCSHNGDSSHNTIMGDVTPTEKRELAEGVFVRQHLWHLKLALERLGEWPNSYSEYERLNADIFREYASDLKGMEGVERWNLNSYGSGQAESQEDLLNVDVHSWGLVEPAVISRANMRDDNQHDNQPSLALLPTSAQNQKRAGHHEDLRGKRQKLVKSYRVRGVPLGWTELELQSFLAEHERFAGLCIKSLALEAHGRWKTATITYSASSLNDTAWSIPLPASVGGQLTFDSDFFGLTTLFTPPNGHEVECVDTRSFEVKSILVLKDISILALSGLGGHAFGSFKDKNGEHMWLRDSLPRDLATEDNHQPIARILLYGYESRIPDSDNTQDLEDIASALRTALSSLINASRIKPIVLVAHSLGGLVVKQALILLSQSDTSVDRILIKAIRGVLFFGVPQAGMDVTSLLPLAKDGPNRPLIESINRGSKALGKQGHEFYGYLERQDVEVFCFYETMKSPTPIQDEHGKWARKGEKVLLVDQNSATDCHRRGTMPTHVCAIASTHSDMVKFGPHDHNYEIVLSKLTEFTRMAVALTHDQTQESSPKLSLSERLRLTDLLSFDQIDDRLANLRLPKKNTCKWILKSLEYKAWIDMETTTGEHYKFLWVKGKPGAGKSILMKYLFQQKKRAPGAKSISFFFNARGHVLERSTLGLYRALLLHLFEKFPELQDALEVLGFHGMKMGEWRLQSLQNVLLQSVRLLKSPVYCYIDALDECPEAEVRDMISFFRDIRDAALTSKGHFYVCFSSRHYPTIFVDKSLQIILEDQMDHQLDIELYIHTELHIGNSSQATEVKQDIRNKASGVFLWVALVIPMLNEAYDRGKLRALSALLKTLPPKLEDLIRDILTRDKSDMDALICCLQWVLFSSSPLQLPELYFAINGALDGGDDGEAFHWNRADDSISSDVMSTFILNASKGLVEQTRSKTPTMQLIHESVRDYLITNKGLQELWLEAGPDFKASGHSLLAQYCVKQVIARSIKKKIDLPLELPKASSEEVKSFVSEVKSTFPFLEYAVKNALYHSNKAQTYGEHQWLFLDDFPQQQWIYYHNLQAKFDTRRYPENINLLFILAERDLSQLLRIHADGTRHLELRGGRYGTPLLAALACGSKEVARYIGFQQFIDQGVSIHNIQDCENYFSVLKPNRMFSPGVNDLQTCLLQLKCFPTINALIQQGTDLQYSGSNFKLLLSKAMDYEIWETVELLLRKGAEFETVDKRGRTPLLAFASSSWRGSHDMVRFLLDHGANVEARDEYGMTPLLLAIKSSWPGSVSLIEQFLVKGANIEAAGNDGRTPLIAAAALLRTIDVLKLLIGKGANIEAGDIHGRTPLLIAVSSYSSNKPNLSTVELLLEKGANIEAVDIQGRTPLLVAASCYSYNKSKLGTIKLLLGKGANIEAVDIQGRTPLLAAVAAAAAARSPVDSFLSISTIELLLEKGANIEAVDIHGRTPLLVAISVPILADAFAIVRLLLEYGANIKAADHNRRTPLLEAQRRGIRNMVELLEDKEKNSSP